MKKQQVEDIAEGLAVSMSVDRLCRALMLRRRWKCWTVAFGFACSLAVVYWVLMFAEKWPGGDLFYAAIPIALVYGSPMLMVFVPVTLGPVNLVSDVRSGRFESILMTTVNRRLLLRVYHRRAFVTVTLLILLFVPLGLFWGRAPMSFLPLAFYETNAFSPFNTWGPEWSYISWAISGLLTDLASAYLAVSLGFAFLILTKRRLWAAVLGSLLTIGFVMVGGIGCVLLIRLFDSTGIVWQRENVFVGVTDPGYSLLLWSFAIPYSVLAYLLGRLVLRLAARRLDRLVTD